MRHLPNLLSCTRIFLTPVIVGAIMLGNCGLALGLSVFAGLTDAMDGYAARRFSATSRFGARLDPIADKLLLVSLYIAFGTTGLAPVWVVWLVVGRDIVILAMALGGLLLTNIREFPPTLWGKISTVLQIAGAVVFLAACALNFPAEQQLAGLTVWLVATGTAWSGVHYIWRGIKLFNASRMGAG